MSLWSDLVNGMEGKGDLEGKAPASQLPLFHVQVLLQSAYVVSPPGFVYVHTLRPDWLHRDSLTYYFLRQWHINVRCMHGNVGGS